MSDFGDFDVLGGVGDVFDFNGDGRLDGAEFGIAMEILSEEDSDEYEDKDELDDEDDDLEAAGLDRFDLEMMDEDERREAMEDAGLDPDDYDDLFY